MPASTLPSDVAPIVIVGAGPVGVRCAQELRRRDPSVPIVVYGTETQAPYNRVKLSSLLAGETPWTALADGAALPDDLRTEVRLGCTVLEIDRTARCVIDAEGHRQPYADLVLATGSRPRVPDIPGIGQAHVYVFRDLADAERLVARRTRSRRTVVLGGGLLGLEAARAMRRFNTEVCVVEHGPWLMASQLDEAGAARLAEHVRRQGIEIRTGARVRSINGQGAVAGVTLKDGERIDCDTVIVAAGIVPHVELALDAGLPIGRAIHVDDRMATSDPHVFAVGECAEHRGKVYGLLAPGLEQAAVAANSLLGGTARYEGSLAATRLKVLDLPVFSIGRIHSDGSEPLEVLDHDDPTRATHVRIALDRGRIVGALAVGPFAGIGRLQEAVLAGRRVWPWQRRRFRRTGLPWSDSEGVDDVRRWPASAIVCNCNGVTRGQLGAALAEGCRTVEQLAACTRASTVCGSCKPLLVELTGADVVPAPTAWGLGSVAALAGLCALLVFLLPGIAYQDSVQVELAWDRLWRDSLLKQISGFTLLGLSLVGLLVSLRKRVRRVTVGSFDAWRLVHVALGAVTLAVLLAHTGARLGHQINLALMLLFSGLILVGSVTAGVIAFEGRLPARLVRTWREKSLWLHILLFWPVPALLAVHVFKTYYY